VEPPQITRLAQSLSNDERFKQVLTVEELKDLTREVLG